VVDNSLALCTAFRVAVAYVEELIDALQIPYQHLVHVPVAEGVPSTSYMFAGTQIVNSLVEHCVQNQKDAAAQVLNEDSGKAEAAKAPNEYYN
jgi:hypothetical protein